MHAQLVKMLEVSENPHVTLRMLPLDAAREIIDGPFTLMKLILDQDVDQRLLYLDNAEGGTISTSDSIIELYQRMFDELASYALSPAHSRDLIARHDRERWKPAMAHDTNSREQRSI
jgi:hypothetical protein